MRRWALALGILALCLPAGVSRAGERFGVGVKAGTLGLGADFTVSVTRWLELRATLNGANVTKEVSESGVDYHGDFRLGGAGVLADFHPFGNRFRLTAGLLKNRQEGDVKATPTQPITIGDTTYTPQQVGALKGSLSFRSVASYFGIGYGSAAKGPGRVGFVFDFGVMPQGEPDVTLAASGTGVSQSDLDKELQEIKDDAHKLRYWPVLALGVSLRL